jgi:hypothetical protein
MNMAAVGQFALVAFLVIGMVILAVAFFRGIRRKGLPPEEVPRLGMPTTPRLPPPEWVDWDEGKRSDD